MHDIFILLPAGVELDISALLDCFIFMYFFWESNLQPLYAKKFLELFEINSP
jgi:hypothetical protein